MAACCSSTCATITASRRCCADGDSPAFKALEAVRAEWVIRIDGRVKARDASLVNPKIPTGEIEVYVTEVEVLGAEENCRCRSSAMRNTPRKPG
jgi:aspartyl-tRNA synthetase